MPHITEGELHAYLDGALSAIDADAEERLTVHLERCADCRTRLERERHVHDRSAELLAVVWPEEVEVPPFESIGGGAIRGRAEPGGRSRLAWAASIAVALGAGWMGHALLGGSGETIPDAGPAPRVFESRAAAAVVDSLSADDTAASAEATGGARANEAVGRAEARMESFRDEAAAEPTPASEARRQEATETGKAAAPAPEVAEETGEEGAERERALPGGRPVDVPVTTTTAGVAVSPAETTEAAVPYVVDARSDVAARGRAFAGAAWRPVALGEATDWVGRPLLAIADLEVVEITVAEVEGLRLARVRQTLPDGAPIELVLERPHDALADRDAAAGPPALRLEPPASAFASEDADVGLWRRVGRVGADEPGVPIEGLRATIDGVWVTLAAPVASDSLRAVVSRVHRLERP